MSLISRIQEYYNTYVAPSYVSIRFTDVLEMILLAFFIYQFMVWIQRTKAYTLIKGIVLIGAIMIAAALLEMNTILWLGSNAVGVALTAFVIVFQPELRKALEELGRRRVMGSILSFDGSRDSLQGISESTISEIIRACMVMSKNKTGALIVIEQKILLTEYERTGIELDALLSAQLLINIFEHNTPLHDGAVIVRGDRIIAATCYLPLSDNMELSKELGTRHRAAVGISEETDSMVIVVSEESGNISISENGKLYNNVNVDTMRKKLRGLKDAPSEVKKFKIFRGPKTNTKSNEQQDRNK